MPEGRFKCDICKLEISNPQSDPKFCPHSFRCGILMLCRTYSCTCEATKADKYIGCICTHIELTESSLPRLWPVHKWIKGLKKWVPWNLEKDIEIDRHAGSKRK